MAINKIMMAAIRAISYTHMDIKKTYKAQRALDNFISKRYFEGTDYKVWDNKVICEDHNVPVRIFMPNDVEPEYTLVFFHGGGWVTGNIDTYDRVCVDMAKHTGQRVVSVDYRLAPENTFPAAPEDCYAVVKEICTNSNLANVTPENVVLIGDSAGANLAAAVSLMARDRGDFVPKKQILIYPATNNNHTKTSEFMSVTDNGAEYLLTNERICEFTDLYIENPRDRSSAYFAPLLAKDFVNQPKTLIISAEFCPLRDEGEYYGEKLYKAGNEVETYRIKNGLHGYFSLPYRFAQVQETYKIINSFLKEEEYNVATEAVEKIR